MSSQYTTHVISEGDTIQSIGALYNVDWTEIVTVNGLEYPYINSHRDSYDTKANIANLGDTLVIPSQGIVIPHRIENSVDELESYTFGGDLSIFSQKTVLNLEEQEKELSDDSNGDLLLVEGLSNLHQQLLIRLGTPKGTLMLHPDFGSNLTSYIGRKATSELLTEISLEVQECILSDFRVKDISNLEIEFRDGGIHIEVVVIPVSPYSSFKLTYTYTS